METAKGYYSVIQYCPDRSRLETVNVGVVLFCPDKKFIKARTLEKYARVRRVFGQTVPNLDPPAIKAAAKAVEKRLDVQGRAFRSMDDLTRFIDMRGNDIQLTPPRFRKIFGGLEADIDRLFEELVEVEKRAPPSETPSFPVLDTLFHRPSLQGRMIFNHEVTVPVLGEKMRIPYAYQNGSLNLIHPQSFDAARSHAIPKATHLAIRGDQLHRSSKNGLDRKLIVISAFPPRIKTELRRSIDEILKTYQVRVVHEEGIEAFVQEVEREAKTLV